jgi:hypothetical protein
MTQKIYVEIELKNDAETAAMDIHGLATVLTLMCSSIAKDLTVWSTFNDMKADIAKVPISPAEKAARAQGWTRDEDIIWNTKHYESWKAAVSWAPENGSVYGTWEECCNMEGIPYESQ